MGTITYTREARCEDCIFLKGIIVLKKDGEESKWKRHQCYNPVADAFLNQRSLKDPACDKWKLT